MGTVKLFCPEEKLPFTGMRGEEVHTYPGDTSARDEGSIIFSMIAGADRRTCLRPESRHIFYPFFATPDTTREEADRLVLALKEAAGTLFTTLS